jgi:hypothetical protein
MEIYISRRTPAISAFLAAQNSLASILSPLCGNFMALGGYQLLSDGTQSLLG